MQCSDRRHGNAPLATGRPVRWRVLAVEGASRGAAVWSSEKVLCGRKVSGLLHEGPGWTLCWDAGGTKWQMVAIETLCMFNAVFGHRNLCCSHGHRRFCSCLMVYVC